MLNEQCQRLEERGERKVEGGRWKVEGGRWKVEGGRWKVEGGRKGRSLFPYFLISLFPAVTISAAVRTEAKIVGDASELVTMPSAISISTISAATTTPYGGVNIATNVFVTGNVGIGTTTPGGKLEVGSGKLIVKEDGNVGIGTTNPGAPFTVGNNAFQVNTSGNIVKLNNVSYSWPGSQGGANTVLTNASGDGDSSYYIAEV